MTDAERWQCVMDDIWRDIGKVALELACDDKYHRLTPAQRKIEGRSAGRAEGEWNCAGRKPGTDATLHFTGNALLPGRSRLRTAESRLRHGRPAESGG